jgi:hypothetical protein
MNDHSIVKKVAAALAGSASGGLGSELPETPGLKLPQGKIPPRPGKS